jgi:peptidoglycan/LPS O-acetylase OafA/YrhL
MQLQQTDLSHPKYRADIDGLRAIAVLAVVAFHAFPNWLRGGFIGVDVFFVISGFLISTIIFENLDRGTFSFKEFYARRIKRIFPALILVLIACFAFGWFVLLADEYKQLGKHIAAGTGFVSNFVLWGEAGYFDNSAETKPLLHLWSLGIEEQFYIVWPFVLWFAWKRKFNLLTITIIVAIASFVLNIKGVKQDMVATFYSPQTRFWELLSGSLLAWFAIYKNNSFHSYALKIDGWLAKVIYSEPVEAEGKTLSNVFSFIGLLLLAYGFWRINKELNFPDKWALVPVLGTALIITAGSKAWVNRKILSNKIAVWFGLISFPLYLWHWPLLSFARIVESEVPSRNIRIAAVVLSIALAWLAYKLVERPIRLGKGRKANVTILVVLMAIVGSVGYYSYSKVDLCKHRGFEDMLIQRKGFEHGLGCSLSWYQGKQDWLFLGNAYDNTVAKLKLSSKPSDEQIEAVKNSFSKISETGFKFGVKTILILGPNKSSIYPEYLPEKLTPSDAKYSSFFLNKLREIPTLTVYDPSSDLIAAKKSDEILYWSTDTHWNNKGAFVVFDGLSKLLNIPTPRVDFELGAPYGGDLIGISKLKDFPLSSFDNWNVVWRNMPLLSQKEISDEQKTAFGSATVVTNEKPLSNQYVWVVGDSFAGALKQYFNATFKEVRYVGHWVDKLNTLPEQIIEAKRKPDLVFIVRVERSF